MEMYVPGVEEFSSATRLYRRWGERVKCGKRDRVYCLQQAGETLAMARILEPTAGVFLLRNLTVAPEHRRQSLARQLMQQLLGDDSIRPLYCYSLDYLQRFYESLGLETLPVSRVPQAIAEPFTCYQMRGKSFVLMGIDLQESISV